MGDNGETRKASPGWYPHPEMADTRRYWDGEQWTENIAPMDKTAAPLTGGQPGEEQSPLFVVLVVGILAAAVIGVVMSFQTATLLTGTGLLWTGAAIALAAGIIAVLLRQSLPGWLVSLAIAAGAIALFNVISVEMELQDMRDKISDEMSEIQEEFDQGLEDLSDDTSDVTDYPMVDCADEASRESYPTLYAEECG